MGWCAWPGAQLNPGVSHTTEILMRHTLSISLAVAVLLGGMSAERADAQSVSALGVDVTIGGGRAASGTYDARGGPALDAILSGRLRPASRGAIVAALSGGVQGPFGGADDCLINPAGGCMPDAPFFSSIGALLGWESGQPRAASLRVLLGPGYYSSGEGQSGGLQGRLDLGTPALGPLALVLSARGAVLPAFKGETLGLWSLGIGFRVR